MSNNNQNIREDLKAITFTMIFEASALNRDEKLGGNIPSIKKLTRFGNRTFSYISRVAMRHYLFETLSKRYSKDGDWIPAKCIESGGDRKVVQFDLKTQCILTHAEIDAFGYMCTTEGQSSITRKSAVGITKAVSLEPCEGDMQFNANHDLASRCGANPNPVNKEEHKSFFKVSFTIDVERIGHDEWWMDIDKLEYKNKKLQLKKSSDTLFEIDNADEIEKDKKYSIKNGTITIEKDEKNTNLKKKVIFKLDDSIKRRRIVQILDILKNGLIYHSSGENDGIVPQFIIAGALRLPIPLFHSFVEWKNFENSILDNAYILSNSDEKSNSNKKLVYVYNPKNLAGEINTSELYTDWSEFLKSVGIQ